MTEESKKLEYVQKADSFPAHLSISKLVTKGKDKVREWQKNVAYTGFSLNAILPDAPGFAWIETTVGEGEHAVTFQRPEYETKELQYLQDALTARIEAGAKARANAGNDPYSTLAEILDATGGGQYRKMLSEIKTIAVQFMAAMGLSEAVQGTAVRVLDPDVLRGTSAGNKAFIRKMLTQLGDANPEIAAQYASILKRLTEAASEDEVTLDTSMLG